MKNWIIVCFLLAGMGLSAQHMKSPGQDRGKMEAYSTAELATLQSKRMTLALDLTDSQEQQVRELLTERIDRRRARHESRRSGADSTGNVRRMPDYKTAESHLDAEIAFRREMKEVLTPEQYDNWKQLHTGKRMQRHGRRHHRGR